MSVSYMTQDGYEKLKSELEDLKSKGREGAAKAIAEAREKEIYRRMQNTMPQKMHRECSK